MSIPSGASEHPSPYPSWQYTYTQNRPHSAPPPPGPHRDLLREAVFLLNVYTQKPQIVAAFVSAVALLASILTCLVMYTCQWCAARRRRRENALAVRIAENAPVNDEWEHEVEKQRHVMRAAPAESEDEEEEARER